MHVVPHLLPAACSCILCFADTSHSAFSWNLHSGNSSRIFGLSKSFFGLAYNFIVDIFVLFWLNGKLIPNCEIRKWMQHFSALRLIISYLATEELKLNIFKPWPQLVWASSCMCVCVLIGAGSAWQLVKKLAESIWYSICNWSIYILRISPTDGPCVYFCMFVATTTTVCFCT